MKLIFILAFACFFSFEEASLLGARECTYGPRYWCGSIVNARECKAVKHCIQTVWEKQILPEDNDDVCAICKDMVKEARDQLLSNQTQEDIKAVFEGSCNLIPVSILRKECIKITDEYIPELVDTLASQMNPQAVCATAQLCNNPYVDRILAEYEQQKKANGIHNSEITSSSNCQDCKKFVQDVSETVQTHSRADVLDHLLAICTRLSSLSEGCMALVQNNFQMIYQFLSTGLQPDDICELFGMCDRMYGQSVVMLPKTGDEPCDFCVAIVNSWRNNLIANTTKEEFKMILNGICHQTGHFEQECLSLVDQYFETIYDILASQIEPREICKVVGLCGPNSIFNNDVPIWTSILMKPENHLPLTPLRPSIDNDNLIGLDEANSYKDDIHLPEVALSRDSITIVTAGETGVRNMGKKLETENKSRFNGNGITDFQVEEKGNNECVMCEFVLHFLQNLLNDKRTREQVEQAVEKVCNLFPHSLSEQCQDYIDAYGDQLIQLLILEIDPASICPMIGLCPGQFVHKNNYGSSSSVDSDSQCVLCEFAMTELDQVLKDKHNEEVIKQTVERLCDQLPQSISDQCKTFIETYIDQIVDLIVNDFTPAQICSQLGLCPRKVVVKHPYMVRQSPNCIICEFIVRKIDSIILEDVTEKEIEMVIEGICNIMPKTVKKNCLNFMEEYGNSLIEYFVSHISPDFICTQLRACKPHISKIPYWPLGVVPYPDNACDVCEQIMIYVQLRVSVDDKDPQGNILENVCHALLPFRKAMKTCAKIANVHGGSLAKLLNELEDKKRVCQFIKKCGGYREKKLLVGAKKCTWGPSYWCQSKDNAESCGATEHCVGKVWENGVPPA